MTRAKHDPLMAALIAKLPVQTEQWPRADRIAWLRMMAMGFDVVYGPCGGVQIAPEPGEARAGDAHEVASIAREVQGELKSTKPPPDTATPEQVAAWRDEHGLPESAAAYVDGLELGDGTVMGEAEKALLASFAEQATKGHWTTAQYNQAVGWYFDLQDRMAAQRDHADGTFKHEAAADLMREWGHDYAVNRNAIAQFFDRSFPADFKDALLTARLPDGRVLANHPTFNRAILEVAKTINPSSTMLPNASGGGLSNVESRIAEIEGKYMRATHGSDPWKSYWSGEAGARMQQEYRGLLASREQGRRGRAG